MEPKFDLQRVKALAASNSIEHWFSLDRALTKVAAALQKSNEESEMFILEEIQKLDSKNFNGSVLIHGDVYDIYGKRILDIPWYIKFSILKDENGEFLSNISFHPTEKPLKTKSETLEKYEGV